MKKTLILLTLFLFSCTNSPKYTVLPKDLIISPASLELVDYTGEIISFTINNPSALDVTLIPDIVIYTKADNKEYIVQRKNEIVVKPTASFTFTFSGDKDPNNYNSLGVTIESTKEYLTYNYKDFEVKPLSEKIINLSINTKNLYYTKENKNILISNEILYGYLHFYDKDTLIKTIPFTLKGLK